MKLASRTSSQVGAIAMFLVMSPTVVMREVTGSKAGRFNTQDRKTSEEKELPL